MVGQDDADNAVLALNGQAMLDRELTVKISEEKVPVVKSNFSRPVRPSSSTDVKRPTLATEERTKRPRRPRIS
jgi:RNA recognition motif-containing protein